ncbi:hypothetical protein ACTFIZ_001320 [Dictyostelium cf. discoideum]
MNVGDEEFKVYQLNGCKYLDMSNKRGTLSKFLFTQEYLHDVFTQGKLDGVIIKRNLSESKFNKFEQKYGGYKVEYVKHGGLVIIYENLSTGIAHNFCFCALYTMFEHVNSFYTQRVLNTGNDLSISLPQGFRQPDLSILPEGRQSLVPTTVVEIGVSQSITFLVNKCASFFHNSQIEIVLGLKIFPKENDNTFKAVAFYYCRTGVFGTCQSIVSFGNCRTTAEEESFFLELTKSSQNPNILKGVLSSNQVLNNQTNTPPFVINILLASLLNGISPQPQFIPSMLQPPVNAPIDLFTVKSYLETKIPANRSFTSFQN